MMAKCVKCLQTCFVGTQRQPLIHFVAPVFGLFLKFGHCLQKCLILVQKFFDGGLHEKHSRLREELNSFNTCVVNDHHWWAKWSLCQTSRVGCKQSDDRPLSRRFVWSVVDIAVCSRRTREECPRFPCLETIETEIQIIAKHVINIEPNQEWTRLSTQLLHRTAKEELCFSLNTTTLTGPQNDRGLDSHSRSSSSVVEYGVA